MRKDYCSLWWEDNPAAHGLICDMAEKILQGRNVFLTHKGDIPWEEEFSYLLKEELKCHGKYDISEEKLNCLDSSESPGRILLDSHVEPQKRKKYRSCQSAEEFLATLQGSIIDDKCFLVRPEQMARRTWKEFVVRYSEVRKRTCQAGFIIDLGDMRIKRKYRGIDLIDISDKIRSYDYILFNLQIVSPLDISNALKMYLADICVAFTDGNLEESIQMVEVYKDILSDTEKYLKEMKPEMTEREITRRLWQIQLKHVFPVIEDFRIDLVKRYRMELETYIYENPEIEKDEKPEEVEWGELYYLIHNTSMEVSPEDYKNIDFFRNGRNRLAHNKTLESEDIIRILQR